MATCKLYRNFVKFGHVIFEIMRADKQTNIQTRSEQ